MPKIANTLDELNAQLSKQIKWIERSAAAFDDGYEDEAGRLAVTIRVLVHDTNNSHSLLDQLGKKAISFFDGAMPPTAGNKWSHGGLVMVATGKSNRFLPPLDDSPVKRGMVTFDQWWNDPVFTRPSGSPLSRKQLVLTAANQDGGAHVDPGLDEDYKALQDGTFLNWLAVEEAGERLMDGAEKTAIRQIAHEILRTLNPSMARQIPKYDGASIITMGTGLYEGSFAQIPGLPHFPVDVKPHSVGRNAPCPCGSGQKFKRCHGLWL